MEEVKVGPGVVVYRENPRGRRMRRAIDVTVAGALALFALPVVLFACLAIFIEDGRPLFFRQRRIGRFERPFAIVKLRTMRRADCVDRLSPTSPGEPRITRVGRMLRRFSIDELPQLVNVLRGEMSLVGPRPEMPFVVAGYVPWQHLRHLITPGVTCIWQTTDRSTIPLHRPEATMLDIAYIRAASPLLDGALLIRTIGSVLFPKGAF